MTRNSYGELVSIADAAVRLDMSSKSIRRRIADGTIPAVRIGRLIRIPTAALDTVGRPLTIAKADR